MGTSRRDLDGWADAFGVKNDDDGLQMAVSLMGKAAASVVIASAVTRLLPDLAVQRSLAQAGVSMADVFDGLGDVVNGFHRHERGL